jgi:hypothetical protein
VHEVQVGADLAMAAPSPLIELLVGTIGLIVIIFLHGIGIRVINRRFSDAWVHVGTATPRWRLNLILSLTIASLSVLHFAETLLWAVPIHAAGMVASLRDSYYFVLESYTTLGEGTIALPERWRLIGPIIAMSGLFTFGWTGSVLVTIMNEFGKLDRSQASKAARSGERSDPEGSGPERSRSSDDSV